MDSKSAMAYLRWRVKGKGRGRGGIRLLRNCSAVLVGLGLWPVGFEASFVPPMRGMRGVMRRIGTRGGEGESVSFWRH